MIFIKINFIKSALKLRKFKSTIKINKLLNIVLTSKGLLTFSSNKWDIVKASIAKNINAHINRKCRKADKTRQPIYKK